MNFDFILDDKGYIKKRENFNLEFKQNFHARDITNYAKTLAGMANNKGGQIIFGIKNKPHEPIGMTNNNFRDTDPKEFDKIFREYFSPELIWQREILSFDGKFFGQLAVSESEHKPVICKKNNNPHLKEATIYYRYRGETKDIEFPELHSIIQEEKEKEKNLWMRHIEKIAKIGPTNVSLLDTYKGEINAGSRKILIDKELINKIKFIKEGNFTLKEGEGIPTLRLIGDVDGYAEVGHIPIDNVYPFLSKDILEKLSINQYDFQALIWKFKIKGNTKYHETIKVGKKNYIHKYSEELIKFLKAYSSRQNLDKFRAEFKNKI